MVTPIRRCGFGRHRAALLRLVARRSITVRLASGAVHHGERRQGVCVRTISRRAEVFTRDGSFIGPQFRRADRHRPWRIRSSFSPSRTTMLKRMVPR